MNNVCYHRVGILTATGLIQRWKEQEYFKVESAKRMAKKESNLDYVEGESGFSLSQLKSFFYIYIFTIFLTMLAFLIEVIVYFVNKAELFKRQSTRMLH